MTMNDDLDGRLRALGKALRSQPPAADVERKIQAAGNAFAADALKSRKRHWFSMLDLSGFSKARPVFGPVTVFASALAVLLLTTTLRQDAGPIVSELRTPPHDGRDSDEVTASGQHVEGVTASGQHVKGATVGGQTVKGVTVGGQTAKGVTVGGQPASTNSAPTRANEGAMSGTVDGELAAAYSGFVLASNDDQDEVSAGYADAYGAANEDENLEDSDDVDDGEDEFFAESERLADVADELDSDDTNRNDSERDDGDIEYAEQMFESIPTAAAQQYASLEASISDYMTEVNEDEM